MGILRSVLGRTVKGAARTAGKALEKALFGNLDEHDDEKPAPPPDPFAKLKAAEAAKKAKGER